MDYSTYSADPAQLNLVTSQAYVPLDMQLDAPGHLQLDLQLDEAPAAPDEIAPVPPVESPVVSHVESAVQSHVQAQPVRVTRDEEEEEVSSGAPDWEGLAESRKMVFESKIKASADEGRVKKAPVKVDLDKEWARTAADKTGDRQDPAAAAAPPASKPSPAAAADKPKKPEPHKAPAPKKMGGDLAAMMAARRKAEEEQGDDGYYF
ncbi:hypothetical protein T484DRAFT_2113116 [Baffinella frigidus]|nr:hypothetical protein T484DRAFT_2113116 [Cryptophyta sp. CCMP2293]